MESLRGFTQHFPPTFMLCILSVFESVFAVFLISTAQQYYCGICFTDADNDINDKTAPPLLTTQTCVDSCGEISPLKYAFRFISFLVWFVSLIITKLKPPKMFLFTKQTTKKCFFTRSVSLYVGKGGLWGSYKREEMLRSLIRWWLVEI